MSKSINEIYTRHTTMPTSDEVKREQEAEVREGTQEFIRGQIIERHRIWLEEPTTKAFLATLQDHLSTLKRGFENFGDNFHNEETLKSAGIQAIKLSVAIKQLTKVINYARTNDTSELK